MKMVTVFDPKKIRILLSDQQDDDAC
uniref:Uncharacterized protein n=1 Tax=Arundo donax TaxID=35708 RepID=A0A0A9AH92_ARUDO